MTIFHGELELEWIEMIIDSKNELAIDKVFQQIAFVKYKILSAFSSNGNGTCQFIFSMIKEIQKYHMSRFEYIFKYNFVEIYKDGISNNKLRWILIN